MLQDFIYHAVAGRILVRGHAKKLPTRVGGGR